MNRLAIAGLMALVALAMTGNSFAQTENAKRVTGLEKRVTKVEKRVTKLETGAASGQAPAKDSQPVNPIAATFIKKKQVLKQAKMGIRLYLELENISNRSFYAFNGTLVFKDASGGIIWSKDYAYSEPISPAEKLQVTFFVTGEEPKAYLKLVKTREITVSLEKQEAYGAN